MIQSSYKWKYCQLIMNYETKSFSPKGFEPPTARIKGKYRLVITDRTFHLNYSKITVC